MCAAVWRIPSSNPVYHSGDDNITNAPPLELQTQVDNTAYGAIKRYLLIICPVGYDKVFRKCHAFSPLRV